MLVREEEGRGILKGGNEASQLPLTVIRSSSIGKMDRDVCEEIGKVRRSVKRERARDVRQAESSLQVVFRNLIVKATTWVHFSVPVCS